MIRFEKGITIPDQDHINGRPMLYAWPEFDVGDSFGVADKRALKRGLSAAKAYSSRHNLGWKMTWKAEASGFRIWRRV